MAKGTAGRRTRRNTALCPSPGRDRFEFHRLALRSSFLQANKYNLCSGELRGWKEVVEVSAGHGSCLALRGGECHGSILPPFRHLSWP